MHNYLTGFASDASTSIGAVLRRVWARGRRWREDVVGELATVSHGRARLEMHIDVDADEPRRELAQRQSSPEVYNRIRMQQ